jgi:hypothetical protein
MFLIKYLFETKLWIFLTIEQACINKVTSGFIFIKYQLSSMKTQFDHFKFPLEFS